MANERVLFTHEQAFEQPEALYGAIRNQMPDAEIVIVPADKVSLADAIKSYLFNAQLVTLPDEGGMALILPSDQSGSIIRSWTGQGHRQGQKQPARRLWSDRIAGLGTATNCRVNLQFTIFI